MGFGTLFIGYFLLLNFTYFGFSDIVAAAIMAMGLYRLMRVSRDARFALYFTAGFIAYSLITLIAFSLKILEIYYSESLIAYLTVGRCLIILVISVLILRTLEALAREVGVEKVPARARFMEFAAFAVFALYIICTAPKIAGLIGTPALYAVAILLYLLFIGYTLYLTYVCYMQICMPGEENGKVQAPSRFGFINRMREEKIERERAEYEARVRRIQEKRKKGGKKK